MNLKNKDITEGMRVTNGKYELRVVSWDKSYTDCLLNYLDSKGNRYVVAQNYELTGTEKDPQISWMNGRYFTANSDDEAFEEYLDYLGEVNEYDIYESKKVKSTSITESAKPINEKINSKYVHNYKNNGDYMISMFDDYNFEILAIPNDKSLFSKDLPKFKIEKTYIYEQYNDDIWLFVGEVEELGWCFVAFDKYANNSNVYAYQYGDNEKYAYIPFRSYILYLENKKVYRTHNIESKKSSRKSLKESAKPINEKNVAKFVDELNKWCDDNVHYKDVDSAQFTKKYGKLYDFKYGWDYSYGDKGLLKVWDDEGTLDWFEESYVKDFIVKLAKKYGWYAEPVTNDSDFTFAEL